MKVTVNNTDKQQDKSFPKLMTCKNGTVIFVKEKIREDEYEIFYLSGGHIGTHSKTFDLYNESNPYYDFNGSITLSND